jgi:hypothetical protein
MAGRGSNGSHEGNGRRGLRRRYIGLILLLLVLITLAAILGGTGILIGTGSKATPEILLPLFLIVGSMALLMTLMAVALTTNFITGRKGDGPGALGMPEGSVSAVIALMLLIVFAVFTVYFFNQIRAGEGDGFVSTGVTAEALQSLPQDRILEITVQNPEAEAAARTYGVRLAAAHPDSIDFAKNAATLVGTLLTAIAGFYFGQKATKSGVAAAKSTKAEQAGSAEEATTKAQSKPPPRVAAPGAAADGDTGGSESGVA